MSQITIYTASIDHRHGTNKIQSLTDEGRQQQIADYCRDEWPNEIPEEEIPEDSQDIIETYFNLVENEFYEINNHTIDLPQPYASALKLLDLCERSLQALHEEDFPQLREELRTAIAAATA